MDIDARGIAKNMMVAGYFGLKDLIIWR